MKLSDIVPREHGTWAMWIVPMISAALVTRFTISFTILFACFALLYVAHRPIVILSRGNKTPETKKTLLIICIPAISLGILPLVLYKLPWLILFWVIELLSFAFSVKTFIDKDQRTLISELVILAALTLTGPAAYYAITGIIDARATQLFILNFLFFGSSVFYVKAKIEFLRSKGRWENGALKSLIITIIYHFILIAVLILLCIFGSTSIWMILGFAPMLIQAMAGILSKEKKVNFTRIGLTLVVHSGIFLVGVRLFLR